MSEDSVHTYTGVADAHGIESIFNLDDCDDNRLMLLGLRAELNRQRHAVMYTVKLPIHAMDKIRQHIDNGDYTGALVVMKEYARAVSFPGKHEATYKNSWSLIPNPKLDPMHSEE